MLGIRGEGGCGGGVRVVGSFVADYLEGNVLYPRQAVYIVSFDQAIIRVSLAREQR